MDELIDEIYRSNCVHDANGNQYPLHSQVGRAEGEFLFNLIADRQDVVRTLEVGCAYGLSSLFITKALRDRSGAHHVIIDPFQSTKWRGIGVDHLRRSGIDFFELREEPSEIALPRLLEEQPGAFDLVFIDGFHTFDQTLVDLYYANRLLRVGGYVAADDCHLPGVAKAMAYLATCPGYEVVGGSRLQPKARVIDRIIASIPRSVAGWTIPRRVYDYHYAPKQWSTVALQKTEPDERHEIWFESF